MIVSAYYLLQCNHGNQHGYNVEFISMAINSGWVNENPCSANKVRPLTEDNIKERYLTSDEEDKILNACTGRFAYLKPIILCALHTGMRAGEILNLPWNCVDLKSNYITLLLTKNGKKRYIAINSILKEVLTELSENKLSEEYVFPNPQTNNPYYDLKGFSKLCKHIGIKNLVFHDLRHSAATRMVAAGIGLATVKSILGHSDLKTTSRYAHPISQENQKAVEALAKYNDKSA